MAAMAAAVFGSIRTVTENRRWPGGSRGAKPPSASHLTAGSPQHPASLRPPSDQPAISMTALWHAHPAAQYNTALSWTCRRPAVAAGLAIRTGTTRLDGDPRPAGPRHRVPHKGLRDRRESGCLADRLLVDDTSGRNDVPAPPGERGGQLRSVYGCGAGPCRPNVPVGGPVYRVWAALWELRSDGPSGSARRPPSCPGAWPRRSTHTRA